MKKVLYGSTALVAAGMFAASGAQAADPIKLGVSGSMQQWFGMVSREEESTAEVYNGFGIQTDTEIDFSGDTTLDNGINVHAQINLNTGSARAAGFQAAVSIKDEWLSVGGGFGTITAGVVEGGGPSSGLHHGAPDVGMGVGDVDQWGRSPLSGWDIGGGWEATDFSVIGPDPGAALNYQSPEFSGFQFSATYAPGANGAGIVNEVTANHDYFDAAVAWNGALFGVNVGADAGFARNAGANNDGARSLKVWNAGLELSFGAVTLAGSYLRVHDNVPANTAVADVTTSNDGASWDVGIKFETGPWALSAMYYTESQEGNNSVAGDETMNRVLGSVQYTLGPGIAWKTTVFGAEWEGEESADNNTTNSSGLVTGLELKF